MTLRNSIGELTYLPALSLSLLKTAHFHITIMQKPHMHIMFNHINFSSMLMIPYVEHYTVY